MPTDVLFGIAETVGALLGVVVLALLAGYAMRRWDGRRNRVAMASAPPDIAPTSQPAAVPEPTTMAVDPWPELPPAYTADLTDPYTPEWGDPDWDEEEPPLGEIVNTGEYPAEGVYRVPADPSGPVSSRAALRAAARAYAPRALDGEVHTVRDSTAVALRAVSDIYRITPAPAEYPALPRVATPPVEAVMPSEVALLPIAPLHPPADPPIYRELGRDPNAGHTGRSGMWNWRDLRGAVAEGEAKRAATQQTEAET